MRRFALIPLAGLFLLFGCSTGPNVVGTWQVTGMDEAALQGGSADVQMKFEAGGNATMTIHAKAPLPGGQSSLDIDSVINGTYAVETKDEVTSLRFTAQDADLTIKGMENLPPQAQGLVDAQKQEMIDNINSEPPMPIEWQGPDKFTAKNGNGTTATFTRIE